MFLLKPVEPANFRHQILLQRMRSRFYNASALASCTGIRVQPQTLENGLACAKQLALIFIQPLCAPKPGAESEEWLDNTTSGGITNK